MNRRATTAVRGEHAVQQAELMVLPGGRILAHNLTPGLAAVLAELNPEDEVMRARAEGSKIKSRIKMKKWGEAVDRAPDVPSHASKTA